MHFTVYNGFENCTLGNVSMYQKEPILKQKINQIYFDFTNASTKYAEKNNVPITPQKLDGESSHWFVGAMTVQCSDGNNLDIAEYEFEKMSPPDIKEDDFDHYKDDAELVLISLDQETGTRIVKESIYKERWENISTILFQIELCSRLKTVAETAGPLLHEAEGRV